MTGTLELQNVAGMVTGRVEDSLATPEIIRIEDGLITGFEPGPEPDSVLDVGGAIVMPGLIDSHAHVVFGDWTPRQNTLGWIESSLHGGVTSMMSASEVHLPGRPHDREGVKALAVTAQRAFDSFRPGGVKIHAGSVIIEPALEPDDFGELRDKGVWLAKVGFGDFNPQAGAADLVEAAHLAGFVVMNHTGGASIPDSFPVTIEDVLALGCDIIGHANGGTTALPDRDLPRLFEAPGAIQLVQAGNLRSSIAIVDLAIGLKALDRILIATDTPTGTGVMPLGMIKTVCEISSLAGIPATQAIAMATGNNGGVLRRPEGILEPGRPADLFCAFAPLGSCCDDAIQAIEFGDIPGIAAVLVDGELKALRSRNTPAPDGSCQMIQNVCV